MTVRAFYSTGFGLQGCYLDDSQGGAQCFTTRRELSEAIRAELSTYDLPASLFREVGVRRLWSAIKRAGSASSYTFHIHHGAHSLSFYGLTEREYLESLASDGDDDDRAALAAYDGAES